MMDACAIGIAETLLETRRELRSEFERKLADLRAENVEVKGMLGDVLAQLGQSDDKLKDIRDDLKGSRALKVRAARLEGLFQGKLSSLASYVDSTVGLPMGWGRDDT
jgi:hypothetical protein